jgi:GH35 family endo-1,4-beta-xylanase
MNKSLLSITTGLLLPFAVRVCPGAEGDLLASASARIEKVRKAPVILRVTDSSGKPVADAVVRIEQKRHAFLFGCNVFYLYDYKGEEHQRYASQFSALFNYATLPFYWGDYEKEPGKTRRDEVMKMAEWCKAYGIETKGHTLIWHEVYPKWGPSDPDATRDAHERRIREIVPDFRGLVDRWDVINEATAAGKFDTGVSRWIAREGAERVVGEALAWARKANPDAVLVYNDYNLGPALEDLLGKMVRDRMPFDVLGIQSHMHRGEWPLEKAWETCETYARFGKPLHYTELTVLSGEHGWERKGPWPTTPAGEALQAEYVEKLYTLLFSHPAVEAITWWDFMDGGWQKAPAGLLRADLSPKPAYQRLLKLVKEQWWTRLSLQTDREGKCSFEGFLGEYEVTVQDGRSTFRRAFSLRKGANDWAVTFQK